MVYIAHSVPENNREQSLVEHLSNTGARASEFAATFGATEEGLFCGILHDIGKYSEKFQRRIRGSAEKADHSTAGAIEAFRLNDVPAEFCIAGHHGGLPDGGNKKGSTPDEATFWGKMKRAVGRDIEDYCAFRNEIELPNSKLPAPLISDKISAFFFTRMLYSCLVDADFLDTEAFMSDGTIARTLGECLESLDHKLEEYTAPWQKPNNEINKRRCQILNDVTEKSGSERGLFTLTVPTGGGKTITSMSFALKHALNTACAALFMLFHIRVLLNRRRLFSKKCLARKMWSPTMQM